MRAAIFDLFGTLVPNLEPSVYQSVVDAMAEALEVEPDAFRTHWSRGFRQRMDGTIRDGDAMFVPILDELGVPTDPARLKRATEIRREFMLRALTPKPGALECLESLAARGVRLALVTDCSSETPELLARTELGPHFPVQAASALLGTTKPDPRMYLTVTERLSICPTECLYIGDGNSEELVGAKRHGMCTVWVDNGEQQYWEERYVPGGDHTIREIPEVLTILDALRAG